MPAPGFLARLKIFFAALLLAAVVLSIGAGCSHYQLGTNTKLTFTTLYIEPVANKTLLPQAQALMSTQLRERLARDGRVTLVNSPQDADATLTVSINDYHRNPATVREDDTGLTRKFTLTYAAVCTLRDNRAQKNLFENRPVTTHRDSFTEGGQIQSEYQTLPLLTESLSERIAHAVLDVW